MSKMGANKADPAAEALPADGGNASSAEQPISIGLLSRDLHRMFNRALDLSVGRFGLASHTTRYLAMIERLGGASPSELSRYFGVRSPTTLTALQVLEKKHLIVRTDDAQDKRRSIFKVTPRGAKINALALESMRQVEAVAVRKLSSKEIAKFRDLVEKIRAALQDELARQDQDADETGTGDE